MNTNSLSCTSFIGEGTYGRVFRMNYMNKENIKRVFALKMNLLDRNSGSINNICEIDILRKFRCHPFIVSIQDIYKTNDVFSSCKSVGTLNLHIQKHKCAPFHFGFPISDSDLNKYVNDYFGLKPFAHRLPIDKKVYIYNIVHIIYNVLIGLEFLHANKIIHADVKADNVLLYINGPTIQGVLTDFGLSSYRCNKIPTNTYMVMPYCYRPPELLLKTYFDEKIDIWGLGCIVYEAMVGRLYTKEMYTGFPSIDDCVEECPRNDAYHISKIIYNHHFSSKPSDVEGFNSILSKMEGFKPEYQIVQSHACAPRLSFNNRIHSNMEAVQFAKEEIGYDTDIMADFMVNLLTLNSLARPTASQLRNHKLFSHQNFKDSYAHYRQGFPEGIENIVNNPKKIGIKIVNNRERNYMISFHRMFMNNLMLGRIRISFRVIIHSLQYCDEFIYNTTQVDNYVPYTDGELLKYCISIFFIVVKLFGINHYNVLEEYIPLEDSKLKEMKQFMSEFEPHYIEKLRYSIYRPTVIETLDFFDPYNKYPLDNNMMKKIFNYYTSSAIENINGVTVHDFTERFFRTIELNVDQSNIVYSDPSLYAY